MSNFYKLNKEYIASFQAKVYARFNKSDKRTETGLLKAILDEVNNLFRKIGGQLSSKRNIPQSGYYPDSSQYNNLVEDICFDVDKLYNAQKLVESDIINLTNFNSAQRDKLFENMVNAQQTVYSAYIKSKKDLLGGVEVPASCPFTSAEVLGPDSQKVFIDEDSQSLTLACSSNVKRPIDAKNTHIYFAGSEPIPPIYPLGKTLGVGSHWKREDPDVHFIDQSSPTEVETYKTMLIDDPNSNIGVGFCEFEAVETVSMRLNDIVDIQNYARKRDGDLVGIVRASYSKTDFAAVKAIKGYLGGSLGKDPQNINVDLPNSLQGAYIKDPMTGISAGRIGLRPKYKLVIPFSSSVLTNQIVIEFTLNSRGILPNIIWAESKAFGNVGGTESQYDFVASDNQIAPDGRYICRLSRFTYPTRVELMLEYSGDKIMWDSIPFYMAHYVYSDYKPTSFLYTNTGNLSITTFKIYDVFVDAEVDQDKEKTRALAVLSHPNRMA